MAAKALLIENPHPTREQIAGGLSGNICSCGAYGAIAQSTPEAAQEYQKQRLGMSLRKSLLALLVLSVSVLLLSTRVCTEAYAQATKLNVASSGISPTQIVPYLAQEAGIYTKNGLEVSVIRTRAYVAVMSMLAGDTVLIDVAGPVVIRSNLKGADNVFIGTGAVAFNYWLMAAKAINTAQDLRGKTVGVASLTGSTMVATRYALVKLGLNPDKDIKTIQIGGTPDRLTALRTGRIQAPCLALQLVWLHRRRL